MFTRESWDEFYESGMLFIANRAMNIYGWTLIVIRNGSQILDIYPAKIDVLDNMAELNSDGHKKFINYLFRNIDWVHKEAFKEEETENSL